MNKDKILTGYDLVSKGATKLGAALPELGLKEIFPNGSWLEKKQVQAALEARKHLIEVERIEKRGVLSHAVWKEDIMMAEVTQKVGGYWQYIGQNKGKDLFLNPEEALFLMEINCLHLTHNDVKVSLQQAYTLLLRGKITLLKYKVYASLSRLGYRVLRHHQKENNKNITTSTELLCSNTDEINENIPAELNDTLIFDIDDINIDNCEVKKEQDNKNSEQKIHETSANSASSKDKPVKQKNICSLKKLEKLKKRNLMPCNSEKLHECFKSVPDLLNSTLVTCKVADQKYLPNELHLRKSIYLVDLKKLSCKTDQPSTSETSRYSPNDEVNGSHIPRLRNTSYRSYINLSPSGIPYQRLQRPMRLRRSHYNFNFINLNSMFQRPFLPNMFFVPQLQFLLRPQGYIRHQNFYQNFHNRKRSAQNAQLAHLESIKNLTMRLKNLHRIGNTEQQNIEALQRLIQTYNTRYKTNIRLTDDLNLVVEEIVDTITLDDDEPVQKRRRVCDKESMINENLDCLKQFATKLKNLENEGKSSARHRRAFSKLLKTFNQSYNEEYYVTETYELGNKRLVTLSDTSDSSNSDCVIENVPKYPIGKKLKNPFNVLKRMSQKQKESIGPSTSSIQYDMPSDSGTYSERLLNALSPDWLPNVNDFGRPEIVARGTEDDEMLDIKQEEFLYDFMKLEPCPLNNWLDLKKSYYSSIKEAVAEFQNCMDHSKDSRINSIVKPQDCLNMESVLKKLSIIKTQKRVKEECSLFIDFDVYNRDVQNFRKTDPPVPHFRILCLSASSNMPSGDEIAALHSKYSDNVAIIFAIVGDSISYVQVNPTDLPVYISNIS